MELVGFRVDGYCIVGKHRKAARYDNSEMPELFCCYTDQTLAISTGSSGRMDLLASAAVYNLDRLLRSELHEMAIANNPTNVNHELLQKSPLLPHPNLSL